MTDAGFNEIADLATSKSGQAFRPSHRYLMEARLASIMLRENFLTLEDLAECLKARPNPVFEAEVVAALTSKETSFFKDRDTLGHIIDNLLIKAGEHHADSSRLVRILCAGGGTGQEAYSLVILMEEARAADKELPPCEIVSLDLCKASRRRAKEGLFGHFEIQMGLSVHRMLKFFARQDDRWQLNEELRKQVDFQHGNLLESLTDFGAFDIILCRDVMPGMVNTIASSVAKNLSSALTAWGVLFLGGDETLPDGVVTLQPSYDGPNAWCIADPAKSASKGPAVA